MKISESALFVLWAIYTNSSQTTKEYCKTVSFNLPALLEPETLEELKTAGYINGTQITPKGVTYLHKESNILSDIRRLVNNESINFFRLVEKASNNSLVMLAHLVISQMGVRGEENPGFWEPKLDTLCQILQTTSIEDLARKYQDAVEKNKNR